MAFSGASTPRFDASYDPTFGTPMFGMQEDKTDYFSSNGKQAEYPFPTGIFGNSPYPSAMDITPPQTAREPPSNWQAAFSVPEPSIEDQMIPEINTSTARIQYGQTTPPDEALRAPSMDDLQGSFSLSESRTLTDTRSAKVSKSGRKSKKQIKLEESNEETDKRSKFLERNRVAASKCRQKKKEYNCNLETRAKLMERENAELKQELQQLQNDKMRYMMEMSLHTPHDCECHAIHQHVAGFKAQFGGDQSEHSRHPSIVSAVPTLESA